ncbi:hypothetical protein [Aurantibacter sp.]|uniref:hypothetical protein n=1 Tax=Aurantibacter sp. TaxID=2807103 RepID=UPI003266585C
MKKAIIVMMLLVGVTTIAQERKERPNRGDMKDLTAEQIATLQTKKMTLALDLTSKQQTQIQAINLEQATTRKAKMAERKAAKEDGERKKPTSEERYAMQNERLDAQIALKSEMKSILSDEQYTKWEKMRHHKKKRGGKKGEKNAKRK